MTTATTASLLEHLVNSLQALPNPYKLDLTVLASEPKRTSSIYPHTPIPLKCYQQGFLVVLSSDLPGSSAETQDLTSTSAFTASENKAAASLTETLTTSNPNPLLSSSHSTPPRVLVSAISAYLYTFPSPESSDTAAVLYISKLDSSGYSPAPLPLTRNLIESFIGFFLLPIHPFSEVRVQLFARAQRQYLFPNSSNGAGKKVLTGAGLSKWWKGVYEGVASDHHKRTNSTSSSTSDQVNQDAQTDTAGSDASIGKERLTLRYLLPGYDENEARILLGKGKELPPGLKWKYQPPFTLPIHGSDAPASSSIVAELNLVGNLNSVQLTSKDTHGVNGSSHFPPSLATLIPSLPDDPKTRFLEELVTDAFSTSNSNGSSSSRRPPSSENHATKPSAEGDSTSHTPGKDLKKTKKEKEKLGEEKIRREAHLALSKVQPVEFWERIGFRQECSSGDVTGFFTLELRRALSSRPQTSNHTLEEDHKGKMGEGQAVTAGDTPLAALGSATGATEVSVLDPESAVIPSDAVSGVISGTIPDSPRGITEVKSSVIQAEHVPTDSPTNLHLRQEILDRLLTALTNVDFATHSLALEGTEIWLKQASSIVRGEIGERGWLACLASVEPKEGALGRKSAVLGNTGFGGAPEKRERKEEVVTMLQPRKKKKKV